MQIFLNILLFVTKKAHTFIGLNYQTARNFWFHSKNKLFTIFSMINLLNTFVTNNLLN